LNNAPLIDCYIDIPGIGARYLMREAQLWSDCRMYCGAGFNGSHPETLVVPTIAYHVDLLATQYSHKVVPATC
jgi:hypothetical protein